ncbi:c-type cytochrome [Primorskyibacter sp. S187A]|uniref:c-type cytochrome n=1 Tax=Primorskyibacter sp. S187A TaxID=3415130 RepID=UPI003C7DBF5D
MRRIVLSLAAVIAATGCTPDGGPFLSQPADTMTAMPDATEGQALYREYCAACHGETGAGDGPLARGLNPAPRNLTLISVRHDNSFPRAKVLSTLDGYTRVQSENTAMPEFGDLLGGESVPVDVGSDQPSPVPRRLAALMFYLETLQQ